MQRLIMIVAAVIPGVKTHLVKIVPSFSNTAPPQESLERSASPQHFIVIVLVRYARITIESVVF
jgi:hypothetical protein